MNTQALARGVAATALTCALALGACGDRTELPGSVAAIEVDGVSAKTIRKHFTAPKTKVGEADMQAALARLKTGDMPLSWEGETVDGRTLTLTGVTANAGTADTVVFEGLRAGEESGIDTVAFDSLTIQGLELDFGDTLKDIGAEARAALETPSDRPVEPVELDDDTDTAQPAPDADEQDVLIRIAEADTPSPSRLRIADIYMVGGVLPAGDELGETFADMVESGQMTDIPGEMGPVAMSGVELIGDGDDVIMGLKSLAFADSDVGTRNGFFDADGFRMESDVEGEAYAITLSEASLAGFPPLEPILDAFGQFSSRMAARYGATEPSAATQEPVAYDREAVFDGLLLPYTLAKVEDFQLTGPFDMTVPDFSYRAERKGDRIDATTRMEGRIDMSGADAELREGFAESFGADVAEFEFGYTTRLDVEDDTMVQTGGASLSDGFDINYEYGAKGYTVLVEIYADMMINMMTSDDPEKAMQSMAMQSFAIMDAYRVSKLDLTFTDTGLYSRLSDQAAAEAGMEPDAFRADAAAKMREGFARATAQSPIPTAIADKVIDAAAEFVTEPGSTFRLVIDPEEPVTFMGLMSLSEERLGFEAETTR